MGSSSSVRKVRVVRVEGLPPVEDTPKRNGNANEEANEEYSEDDISSKKSNMSSTVYGSFFSRKPSVVIEIPPVTPNSQALCVACWRDIDFFIGPQNFCRDFFTLFDTTYPESAALFRPRRKAGNYYRFDSRYSMLINVVRFLLRFKDTSFNTKRKLRAIGRMHYISGVTKEHVRNFNEILLRCIKSYLGPRDLETFETPWRDLLEFTAQEMYIEDIQLV